MYYFCCAVVCSDQAYLQVLIKVSPVAASQTGVGTTVTWNLKGNVHPVLLIYHLTNPCPHPTLSFHIPSQSLKELPLGHSSSLDNPKAVTLPTWQLASKKHKAAVKAFKGCAQNWSNVILVIFILLVKAVTMPVHTEGSGEINSISWWNHIIVEHVGWKMLWSSLENIVCHIQQTFDKYPLCPQHQARF